MKILWQTLLIMLFPAPIQAALADPLPCSLPAPPDSSAPPHPDSGIDLGDIISQDTGTGFAAAVEPTVQLDFENGSRSVDLTEGPQTKELVFADSRAGYEVLDQRRIEGGLGADLLFRFGNSTLLSPALWATVGLMPLRGGGVEALRFFPQRDALDKRATAPLPNGTLAALDQLQAHDSLAYDTTGGLVFWAGAGYGSFGSVTVSALAQGDFRVSLVKVDGTHAHVRISELNVKALGIQAGNLLAEVSVTEFSRTAASLSFFIDFHDTLGAKALLDLIHGNAAPVQKLAAGITSAAVQFLDEETASRLGVDSHVNVGVPSILGFSWGRAHYFEALRERDYACGRNLTATYGAYVRHSEGAAFGVEQENTRAFYGTSYALKGAHGTVARGFGGELVWIWRGRSVAPDTFRRAINELVEDTGLGAPLELNVPSSVQDRLDYSSLSLRARFGATHVLRLQRAAEKPLDVCKALASIAPDCEKELQGGTRDALNRMFAALREMSQALLKSDEKRATMAFARFGDALLTNRFTLRAGLALAGDGLPVDFVAEGSDFHRRVSLLRLNGALLVPEQRIPLVDPLPGHGWDPLDSIRLSVLK